MRGWLYLVVCWMAQSTLAQNFTLPTLPISKADARHPDCRTELVFVVDVSGSVSRPNQLTIFRFVTQLMIAIEQNVLEAKFGVVVFGISGAGSTAKWFDDTKNNQTMIEIRPPYGNGNATSTELLIGLGPLGYGCPECAQIGKPAWSQLDMLYSVTYQGSLTPTWDGLLMARDELLKGDPAVPGRFVVLITDGVPNDVSGDCVSPLQTPVQAPCVGPINKANEAVNLLKQGALLLTVGMELENSTSRLMVAWASEPKDVLAVPSIDYSKLADLIPRLSQLMCPYSTKRGECLAENATSVSINGQGFLNTGNLRCRFSQDGDASKLTRAMFVNSTLITCPIPTGNWSEWNVEYTQDGRGYYNATRIKAAFLCRNKTSSDGTSDQANEGSAQTVSYGLITVSTAYLLYFSI